MRQTTKPVKIRPATHKRLVALKNSPTETLDHVITRLIERFRDTPDG